MLYHVAYATSALLEVYLIVWLATRLSRCEARLKVLEGAPNPKGTIVTLTSRVKVLENRIDPAGAIGRLEGRIRTVEAAGWS